MAQLYSVATPASVSPFSLLTQCTILFDSDIIWILISRLTYCDGCLSLFSYFNFRLHCVVATFPYISLDLTRYFWALVYIVSVYVTVWLNQIFAWQSFRPKMLAWPVVVKVLDTLLSANVVVQMVCQAESVWQSKPAKRCWGLHENWFTFKSFNYFNVKMLDEIFRFVFFLSVVLFRTVLLCK